eukprot:scaffold30262_cov96-Isochrysis_galbana.AAC.2
MRTHRCNAAQAGAQLRRPRLLPPTRTRHGAAVNQTPASLHLPRHPVQQPAKAHGTPPSRSFSSRADLEDMCAACHDESVRLDSVELELFTPLIPKACHRADHWGKIHRRADPGGRGPLGIQRRCPARPRILIAGPPEGRAATPPAACRAQFPPPNPIPLPATQ